MMTEVHVLPTLQDGGHLEAIVSRLRLAQGSWFVKPVDTVMVKKNLLGTLIKSIRDLNRAQEAGPRRHTVTTHMEVKKYLVWGLEEADVDAGVADVKVRVIYSRK